MQRLYSLANFLALFAFLPLYQSAYAKDPLPSAVIKKLKQVYPGASEFEWETGLINSDEITDIVVLVSVPAPGRHSSEALAVFYGDQNAGYQLEAASLLWSKSDRISWNLSIEKSSVFLNFECGTLCGNEASNGNYQFKDTKGKLVLIGEGIVTYSPPNGNDDSLGYSINYLTRNAIFWRKIGNKHKEVNTRFPGFSPIGLSQFNRWESNDPRPKEARGYIDEKLKYVSH